MPKYAPPSPFEVWKHDVSALVFDTWRLALCDLPGPPPWELWFSNGVTPEQVLRAFDVVES